MSKDADRLLDPDHRAAIIFGLEVASNDYAASETTRANAERCLRNQRAIARYMHRRQNEAREVRDPDSY